MDKSETDDLLVALGGEVKMLENGNVGGYLVRFSGPKDPDLYGDYFTKSTDYGIHQELPVYYQHGADSVLKNRRIGKGTIKTDDVGLWFEAQLEKRDEYEKYIQELVQSGKLGYSSGAVGHLVTRKEAPNGTFEITTWPLGEGSLVVNPAEPRNGVMPIKEFLKMASDGAQPEATKAEDGQGDPSPVAAPAQSDAMTDADASKTATTEAKHTEGHTMADEQKEVKEEAKSAPDSAMLAEIQKLIEAQNARMDAMQKEFKETATTTGIPEVKGAPAYVKETGDSMAQAFARWVKTGDRGAAPGTIGRDEMGREMLEIKASNATSLNITTAADGGNTVTDDMFTSIIRRADERSLAAQAGVRRFTSNGTTLDIPIDDEADGEFVVKAESAQFDEDAPAIGQVQLTKAKYTKRTLITYELMQDTSVNLMEHVMERVAMGKAKTDNSLLVAAVVADGTEFDVFASDTAIAVDELENLAINDTNAWYLDNPADGRWIMRPSTHKAIAVLDDTSIRRYFDNQQGDRNSLLGSQILYSNKVDAIGSGNKPVLFGNFNYVAQLEDPTLQFLRDPYTRGGYGEVSLYWYYRTAFKVLQAAAVGYGRNTTS